MEIDELKQLGILIVDDDEFLPHFLSEFLSDQGYKNLHVANDGYEAIHLLAKLGDSIYVVVLDLAMPKVDGFGVIKHLLNNHEYQIGVVIYTGFSLDYNDQYVDIRKVIDSDDYDKCISYLSRFEKPLKTNRLQNEVEKVLLSISEMRRRKSEKENKQDDVIVKDIQSCIEKCKESESIKSYRKNLINTLDEIRRCYITECYMATISLCEKVFELLLKQILKDKNIQFKNDQTIGGLIETIRKNGMRLDKKFDDILNIINQNKDSTIHASEEVGITTRENALLVLYAMIVTIKKVLKLMPIKAADKGVTKQTTSIDSSRLTTLRHSTKCREKCREIAQFIWSSDPSITIREMTENETILANSKSQKGELYSEKTIRDWIKDLCPDRSPGRPKKS